MAVQGQSTVEKRLLNLSNTVIVDTLDASVLQRETHECCVERSVTLNTLEDLLVLAKASVCFISKQGGVESHHWISWLLLIVLQDDCLQEFMLFPVT